MIVYSTDPNAISAYLGDESSAFTGHAERVCFPAGAEDVAAILAEAARAGAGVTISGGGTSITGARVPTTGGWVLATDRLCTPAPAGEAGDAAPGGPEAAAGGWTRIAAGDGSILLDAGRMLARVPAGIRLSDLDAALASHGLFYPPTLTETSAMIGGTIATNASGARSYHHGPTRCWVEAIRVVTPRGDNLWLRRGERRAENGLLRLSAGLPAIRLPDASAVPALRGVKNAAGYLVEPAMDAVDLFVGGEGTLGVVTEAELRLAPRPGEAVTLLVFVRDRDRALDFADEVRDGMFGPWTVLAIEYFDRNSLRFMSGSYPDTPDADAAVLVELAPADGAGQWYESPEQLERWQTLVAPFGPADVWAVLPTEREQVRLFRHSLPDHVNDYVRNRRGKLGTDFAVPAGEFRTLMRAYDDAASAGVKTVLFGHLGEYHLHLNFLAEDEAEMERARELYAALAQTTVRLGGTVSAEHGVGKKRVRTVPGRTVPYLEIMVGKDGMRVLRDLKRQLDPEWILNRDTLIPWDESE